MQTITTEQEINKNNKLIADFLGASANKGGEYDMYQILDFLEDKPTSKHYYFASEMQFNESWDWLMVVLNKISTFDFELVMHIDSSYWNAYGENPLNKEFGGYENISNIYEAITEFIKWYNNK